ncbi:MAG TPA: aldo/keto reductase, partial [Stellaceae bacterium]
MKYLDIKGARVPAIGLGTWQLSGRGCEEAVRQALDLGYRHIDTAQMYGNEAEVGRAIRASGLGRDQIFLTTKLAPGNLAAGAVRRTAEESLRRLGTDHVDLLLIHWPTGEAPLGETLGAMADLRAAGKTRHIGVSNFNVQLLKEAMETYGADLLCNQVEYHPYLSQRAVLAAVRRYGMMLTAYTPLARGRVARDPTLAAIGRKHDKSPAQVALRWLLDQD